MGGALERVQIFSSVEGLGRVLGIIKQREQLASLLKLEYTLTLPH